jgi:hypothetical protein
MRSTGIVPRISYGVTVGEVTVNISASPKDLNHLAEKWAISGQPKKPRQARGFFDNYFFFGLPQQSLYSLPEPQGHLSVGLGVIFFTSSQYLSVPDPADKVRSKMDRNVCLVAFSKFPLGCMELIQNDFKRLTP